MAQAVCSASRAALLTGCYANRVGMAGALNHTSPTGIHPDEQLLLNCYNNSYATGMFGKWHLGLSPYFSPLKNGFDQWLGIPYSNDNTKYHPVLFDSMPPLPLFDGDQIIELDPIQSELDQPDSSSGRVY
ncbi:MAG: sulfatase-like hydrolase/transferase [Pirellulaceae bacterium]